MFQFEDIIKIVGLQDYRNNNNNTLLFTYTEEAYPFLDEERELEIEMFASFHKTSKWHSRIKFYTVIKASLLSTSYSFII